MSTPPPVSQPAPQLGRPRFRAYLQFVAAVLYFFLARSFAHRVAIDFAGEQWVPLAEQALLALLLLVGYAGMGIAIERQLHPISDQGLPLREGWPREAGLGLVFGWTIAVVCILPILVAGGIAIVLNLGLSAWGWLVADVAFFLLATLAEEIAFRGYGFQRFLSVVGPLGASLGFAAYYAIVQGLLPGSTRAGIAVSIVFSLLLSAAYLRSRALWVSWGLNFGWKASRALVFGLAVNGVSSHSPVVQGNPMAPCPFWVSGGGFGLDGSWITFAAMLAALPILFRVMRDLDFRYNVPVLIPGGIPVDIEAAAHGQHEAAMASAQPAAPSPLVQIQPTAPQAPPESPQNSGR